jgi:uncharacterized protein YicC (UPF0701 family)
MYFVSEELRILLMQRLSKFTEGKGNSKIVKNVTSVICRSDLKFEHLRLKDHVCNSVHVRLYEKWLKTAFDY